VVLGGKYKIRMCFS